ncbi:uncharacterized protein LOC111032944 [Myzus persicae]|uniref:uncharacterized protein LOC111032944 n=1 Tax=Myzus persicae TaxID=13164 RepID=UPI000B93927A|nr:uncharacterized protein LOC111032944 [Myzus persicae]
MPWLDLYDFQFFPYYHNSSITLLTNSVPLSLYKMRGALNVVKISTVMGQPSHDTKRSFSEPKITQHSRDITPKRLRSDLTTPLPIPRIQQVVLSIGRAVTFQTTPLP